MFLKCLTFLLHLEVLLLYISWQSYFIFVNLFYSIVLFNNYKKIGDPYLQDYVAFVAKSKTLNRACYVMECKGGIAQDVIMTIGQAFELR